MRTYLRLVVVAALVMSASFIANASERTSIGKKGEIALVRPTHFGTTLVAQGNYQVHHQMIDGEHYLILRHQELGRDGLLRDTGHDVARVPCRILSFDTAPQVTELHWTKEPNGTGTATQIRIRGEGAGHVVVLEPTYAR